MNDSQYTTRHKERESFEIIYFYGLLPIEQSNLHEPFFLLCLILMLSLPILKMALALIMSFRKAYFPLLMHACVWSLFLMFNFTSSYSTLKTQLDFLSGIKGRKERNWIRKVFSFFLLLGELEARNKWKSLLFEEVYVNNPDLCILSAKIWGNKNHNKSISAKCHNL